MHRRHVDEFDIPASGLPDPDGHHAIGIAAQRLRRKTNVAGYSHEPSDHHELIGDRLAGHQTANTQRCSRREDIRILERRTFGGIAERRAPPARACGADLKARFRVLEISSLVRY